jgi:hypothetical protein
MKKVSVLVVLTLLVVAVVSHRASALPPINAQWQEKYSALKDEVVKQLGDKDSDKCNVCHVAGMGKKEKNAYGVAVGKFVTKAKYNEIKENADAAKAYILEGLGKAEAEKNAAGKTYGEIIKSGKLPGAE